MYENLHHHFVSLQNNNTWDVIAAIGTVLAAFISLYSAKQSAKSALEAKRATQASLMPILEPDEIVVGSERQGTDFYFEVRFKNVGQGLAQNINLSVPKLGFSKKLTSSVKPDGSIAWTRSETLPENEAVWNGIRGQNVDLNLTYEDIFGNKITSIGDFEVSANSFHTGSPHWTVKYED